MAGFLEFGSPSKKTGRLKKGDPSIFTYEDSTAKPIRQAAVQSCDDGLYTHDRRPSHSREFANTDKPMAAHSWIPHRVTPLLHVGNHPYGPSISLLYQQTNYTPKTGSCQWQ
jgi:hypothetical protein